MSEAHWISWKIEPDGMKISIDEKIGESDPILDDVIQVKIKFDSDFDKKFDELKELLEEHDIEKVFFNLGPSDFTMERADIAVSKLQIVFEQVNSLYTN